VNAAEQHRYLRRMAKSIQRGLRRVEAMDKGDTPITATMRCLATEPWRVGNAELRRFIVGPEQARIQRLRAACNPQRPPRFVPEGAYWQLLIDGGVMMSDTPDEKFDHVPAIAAALRIAERGVPFRCLVNGFGLGLVTNALLAIPQVSHVTVVEINGAVIRHMAPYTVDAYGAARVSVVHDDAFAYRPPRGEVYGVVWHDIWKSLSVDNLPDMHRLHRRYGRRAEWQGSWARDICEAHRRECRRVDQ